MRSTTYCLASILILSDLTCSAGSLGPSTSTLFLKAQVNGAVWSPTDSLHQDAILVGDTALTLTGQRVRPGPTVDEIVIRANISGPGLYSLDSTGNSGSYAVQDSVFGTFPGGSGEIRINELDRISQVIGGTFAFQARLESDTLTVSVTQGRFRLCYRAGQSGCPQGGITIN
jgi:hypothetical protein